MKKNLFFISLLVMVTTTAVNAQDTIKQDLNTSLRNKSKQKLNLKSLEQQLASNHLKKSKNFVVSIPNSNGKNETFVLTEREILSDKLKEKFPQIKSYYGYAISDPLKKISLGYSTSRGINAIVYDNHDKYIIEKKEQDYFLIDSKELTDLNNFKCATDDSINFLNHTSKKKNKNTNTENPQNNNPAFYRKYRLAIATDYSYNSYFAKEGEKPTLETSLAAVNETLTYVLPIYENELSISFQLVDDLDKITFLTEESNPYNVNSEEEYHFILENQRQLDEKIGSENYDLGILFTNNVGGGLAWLGAVCNNTYKGSSYAGKTAGERPEGFIFGMIAAHEMGHLFGASHTYSKIDGSSNTREIGSGVTVMGYSGLTGTHDVQSRHMPQFHNYTLKEINNYLATQNCSIFTPNTNNPPIANAGKDYTIPKGTAFKLTGTATDIDNDNLTYSWEQNNPLTNHEEDVYQNPEKNNTEGANFRVYEHSTNPIQYFPPLENVLNNQLYSTWNTVSDVARELNFNFQVRDNQKGGGQIAVDSTKINVTNDGPFKINNITLNQSFKIGEEITLKWDIAGTNGGEINTKNVCIKLTTDNGNTFTTLVESTPNNGSSTFNLPTDLKAEKANIIIEAIDNIYYATSPFIAIGYQVALSCKEYTIKDVILNDQLNYLDVSISGEPRPIEDITLLINVENSYSSSIGILFAKAGENYIQLKSIPSNTPNFNNRYNRFGKNHFEKSTEETTPAVDYLDLAQYESIEANGNYSFVAYVLNNDYTENNDTKIVIDKIGVELCFREATTLNTIDLTKQNELFIYPNPTNGQFNIRITTKTNKVRADIINMAGQVILTKQFNTTNNKIDHSINASNLPKGTYIVKIVDDDQSQTKKLIIK